MQTQLFSKADEQSIELVERAVEDLRRLGATVVDPGPRGALLDACLRRYVPEWLNSAFARQLPQRFPVGPDGKPSGDHIATLLDMHFDPALVPEAVELRNLGTFGPGPASTGEDRYMIDRYLRERGDANIETNADLISKARFYSDPHFPDRKAARERAQRESALDTSLRLQYRFAMQTSLLQCMREPGLDALVAPTSTVPPRKLTAPREPTVNGRSAIGWSFFGQQGFPVMTVPAGFTTEIWDRVRADDAEVGAGQDGAAGPRQGGAGPAPRNGAASREGRTRLVGPISARLPVGVDFIGKPFGEALLIRIGAAYEAATRHREPPPDFGPLTQP
jgi:Asp-tRNA(Asn)/Glu-tRNA(Gln) amidotransferase A subunit family amidase